MVAQNLNNNWSLDKNVAARRNLILMVPCGSNTIYSVKIKTGDQKGKSVRVYASSKNVYL